MTDELQRDIQPLVEVLDGLIDKGYTLNHAVRIHELLPTKRLKVRHTPPKTGVQIDLSICKQFPT
jgi:hypothetical protein